MTVTLAQAAVTTNNDIYLLWGFILAAVALALLLVELLVPSGGLLGLLCGVAAIGSIFAFFRFDTTFGIAASVVYAVGTPIVLVFVFKVWLHSPLARRMVLGGKDEPLTESQEDAQRASAEQRRHRLAHLRQLIGAEGVTVTALRPVGFVTINGQRLDGMAETGIIEANTPVVVTDVYDNQVKVRPRTP